MLPWLERLGRKIPLWDFRCPGVTSISADVHKYGYCSKGASVILYKVPQHAMAILVPLINLILTLRLSLSQNAELRSYQYFAYAKWPGGLFGSPSMAGSRPGGMLGTVSSPPPRCCCHSTYLLMLPSSNS